MLKKLLLAASAIGLVAVPTVASANPYYNNYAGVPHSRSYGSVYGGGGYGAYASPYSSYYGNQYAGNYGAYGNPYGGYYGNSYGYRSNRHRNNSATGVLVGGLIGAVIGGAIANGGHRY